MSLSPFRKLPLVAVCYNFSCEVFTFFLSQGLLKLTVRNYLYLLLKLASLSFSFYILVLCMVGISLAILLRLVLFFIYFFSYFKMNTRPTLVYCRTRPYGDLKLLISVSFWSLVESCVIGNHTSSFFICSIINFLKGFQSAGSDSYSNRVCKVKLKL